MSFPSVPLLFIDYNVRDVTWHKSYSQMVTIQFSYSDVYTTSALNCEAILDLTNAFSYFLIDIYGNDSIPSTIGASRTSVYFTLCVSQVSTRGFHLFSVNYALCYFIFIVGNKDYLRTKQNGNKATQFLYV